MTSPDATINALFTHAQPFTDRAYCNPSVAEVFTSDPHVAVQLCRNCPVMDECRAWAIEHGEWYGVWGGLTQRKLRQAVRARVEPTITATCGTPSGASAHYARHEPLCVPCRRANVADVMARRGRSA
ncbi:WhiB family transcriptional regulator [Mycobacterium asiaticum]|uniref:WhiB family transcriptional regulator n=1 Tax=Mycobacterium asiaticum TaxID=1790 RepID=UPI0007EFAE89|nr:WhiB family transcriptional regulator [Mycobacterium asiaticum]OBJ62509.1 hypothetical protein A9W94_11850 [Mycobacterium asiaticum]